MRLPIALGSLALGFFAFPGALPAQGNDCAPPSFRGPDGPRPSQPPADQGSGTGRNTGAGDTGRPTPRQDPTTGGRDPRGATTGGPRGMALTFTRGKSSKLRLQIDWRYPKPTGEAVLDYESALAEIRGSDPRPLLVLREGSQYGSGYDVMLHKKFKNEKLALLTRWFHCVRFSSNVMEESHPYHSLFSGKYPPQVFVVTWDGHESVPLSGIFAIGHLNRALIKVLKLEYRKDPGKAVTQWLRILDAYDTLDGRQHELQKQIDDVEFEEGPKSKRLRSLKARFGKLARERARLVQKEKSVMDLGLVRKVARPANSKLLERIRGTK